MKFFACSLWLPCCLRKANKGLEMNRRRTLPTSRPVSAGVLLYKRSSNEGGSSSKAVRYLLGMIPQRNFWTVFKGMPESSANESLEETALREFEEETGTKGIVKAIRPETTLRGSTAKKDLVVFLQEGSAVSEDDFDLEQVVKIDQGYMEGQPEIVTIRWLTLEEATSGTDGAKIYPSQKGILEQAQTFLEQQDRGEL